MRKVWEWRRPLLTILFVSLAIGSLDNKALIKHHTLKQCKEEVMSVVSRGVMREEKHTKFMKKTEAPGSSALEDEST